MLEINMRIMVPEEKMNQVFNALANITASGARMETSIPDAIDVQNITNVPPVGTEVKNSPTFTPPVETSTDVPPGPGVVPPGPGAVPPGPGAETTETSTDVPPGPGADVPPGPGADVPSGPGADVPPGPGAETGGIDLDSRGFPWDERIHAKTKTKKVDGEWKLKRGVDKNLVAQVQAETINGGSTDTTSAGTSDQSAEQVVTITPEMTLAKISELTVTGALAFPVVTEIVNKYGLQNITDITGRPDLAASIYNELCDTQS